MKQNGATLQLLKKFETAGIPAFDCMVFHHGKMVFRYYYGCSDENRTKKINGTERYNIYSCSKLITCTAAMQLVENDTIRLDDAVSEYLPEFRSMKKIIDGKLQNVQNTMTIRHLFTMTAGLTYNVNSDNLRRGIAETNGTMPTRDAMKYLACDPLIFEPGSNWNYSLCHDVLAAVIEVVTGKRFGLYVKENIFDRIGMKNSTFLLPQAELDSITAQYIFDTKSQKYISCGPQIHNYKLGSEYESGGAGCISTVDDYMLFIENLRKGEVLLQRDSVARMSSPQISKFADEAVKTFVRTSDYSYGLGVRCPIPGGSEIDFGWSGAAGAYLAIIPEPEVCLFYVQHVIASPIALIRNQLRKTVLQDLI